jgi:hypothetical protein
VQTTDLLLLHRIRVLYNHFVETAIEVVGGVVQLAGVEAVGIYGIDTTLALPAADGRDQQLDNVALGDVVRPGDPSPTVAVKVTTGRT